MGTLPRENGSVPFATEKTLREAMEETAAIESKLMEVSLERSQVRIHLWPQGWSKNFQSRQLGFRCRFDKIAIHDP